MSDSVAALSRKIASAGDLRSVVRTMKALAASSIGQYEKSVAALVDYDRTIELGLSACFRVNKSMSRVEPKSTRVIGAVVFGSDQGLVGQFNEVVTSDAVSALATLGKVEVWAVGERVHARLVEAGTAPIGLFAVPSSVEAIATLVGEILIAAEARSDQREVTELHVFYNRSTSESTYAPARKRVLPLDEAWRRKLASLPWPTKSLPDVMGDGTRALRALIREYVFVSLFRACAESLASENASRLAAMERADKNIDDLLEKLHADFHRIRQSGIDEELFDVVAGSEALEGNERR